VKETPKKCKKDMAKKNKKQVIRPDTCAKCKRGTLLPVSKGNPRIVHCIFLNKRFVADSKRKCIHAY
jgi:hypothetical protein